MLVHLRSTRRSTVGERERARHDLSIHGACPSIRFIVIAQRDDISCPRLARASSVRPRDEDLTIANQSSIIYSLLTIHRDVPRPANSSRWPELKSCSSCCWRTARGKSSGLAVATFRANCPMSAAKRCARSCCAGPPQIPGAPECAPEPFGWRSLPTILQSDAQAVVVLKFFYGFK